MKQLILLITLCFCTSIYGAERDSINQKWIESHYTKREVMIPMRDGVKLFTAIYEPKDNSKFHPILMNRQCYGCAPYGESFNRFSSVGYYEYIRNGYIIVYQDVRGKNKSEGKFEDIRPYIPNKTKKSQVDEASDTYDTAEWLIHNTHTNKCIGVHGISYPGFYSTMAALSWHPAIKAVTPQAPVTDWFRGDDDHHNGVLCLMDMFSFEYWFEYQNTPNFWGGMFGRGGSKDPADIVKHDVYTDYLRIGAVKNFTKLYGDSIEMWNLAVAHPNMDEYWKTHTVTNYVQYISGHPKAKPAIMVVGGLYDAEDCYGAFDTYKAIKEKSPKTEVYIVDGPWSHGAWRYEGAQELGDIDYGEKANEENYMMNMEYPFFAYYLEGKGQKPEYGARIFDSGTLDWYNIKNGWDPKAETFESNGKTYTRTKTAFYLQPNGAIWSNVTDCPNINNKNGEYTEYVSDPARPVPYIGDGPHDSRKAEYMNADQRFASWRPDVLVFQTEELKKPLSIVGTPEVDFTVSASTTDADFIVKIIDVDEEGSQNLIRWEVMRGKYRNSFSNPEPMTPDAPTPLKFVLNDMSHTFLAGHKLMIQVQSSMFPLLERNPQKFCNTYTCDDSDFQKSTIRVYHSGELQSKVWLPVVK